MDKIWFKIRFFLMFAILSVNMSAHKNNIQAKTIFVKGLTILKTVVSSQSQYDI